MISSQTLSTRYTLLGTLFDENGLQVQKKRFNLYQDEKTYLGCGKTDSNGHFSVKVRGLTELDQKVSVIFRLCNERKIVQEDPVLGSDFELCRNFSFLRARTETAEATETFVLDRWKKDLGEVYLETPYEKEKVPLKYTVDIVEAAIPSKVRAFIQRFEEKIDFFNTHDDQDVLNAYHVEPIPLTASNTWKLITNGICPLYFKEVDDYLVADINWDRYEFDKLNNTLANVKVFFKKNGDEDPVLERIEMQYRQTFAPSSDQKNFSSVKTCFPDDDDFEEVLREVNSAFHVFGQTVFHLALGHVYGAQVAVEAFDFLVNHALGDLILPHCEFIRKITMELGGPIIFEKEGVLNVSALSVKGIARAISDALAARDPFSFSPREPINDRHDFAKVQNHHFDLLKEALAEYFDKHWKEIEADWQPVHGFFRSLFKHSPLYRPYDGVEVDRGSWRDTNEIGGNSEGLPSREAYRDEDNVRSFRHIACDIKGPKEGDRELIEQFCVDFIHHVTIWHSWIHRSQYKTTESSPSVKNFNFAPLAVKMTMDEEIHQLEIGDTFERFNVEGYRLVDGNGVYPGIIDRVFSATEGYLKNGIDPVDEIQVSTVI